MDSATFFNNGTKVTKDMISKVLGRKVKRLPTYEHGLGFHWVYLITFEESSLLHDLKGFYHEI